ncbi:ADP-ribose pyrophosphatase YjhB (NUDIX family) [Stackebrandtia albiflava]|uniref:ADP-ribose pyrophosphatase YjhB (NUDIX family) n=1 Tax=Stackebrandtia albiflava TaxID=406432 RepID=A0A562UYY6_9ACTN|nr:ADP-ribose pyrophosphatase YjhB (NUDIX family) [Stackebrandtia albiflava]
MTADPVPGRVQRIAAYAHAERDGAVLLVRVGGTLPDEAGTWMLPGGGVEHGEHPAQAVVREVAEETGLDVTVEGLTTVGSDHRTIPFPSGPVDFHCVYFVYRVRVTGGTLRDEPDGTTRSPSWLPIAAMATTPLLPSMADTIRRLTGHTGK